MDTLSQLLQKFDGSGLTENELQKEFEKIAIAAIYGGYFRVNDEFNIHIVDVEFYFHSENENVSSIHDWAMYHRGKNVDYFPVGSLHPHKSGIDVTFEKEDKYRASFLIRQYEIVENGIVTPLFQPSYLCEDLFGYADCICSDGRPNIKWETVKNIKTIDSKVFFLEVGPRVKVGAYDENGKRIKGQFDDRNWRFTRKK